MLYPPLTPLIITSGFGPRPKKLANGLSGPLHPGVDLHAILGQPVHAAASGEVIDSRLSCNDPPDWTPRMERPADLPPGRQWPRVMGYGNLVTISHEDGTQTRYAHLARRLVEAGQHVEAGQVIGLAGSTGYSFGVHVHMELRGDGGRSFIDPASQLEGATKI